MFTKLYLNTVLKLLVESIVTFNAEANAKAHAHEANKG